MTVAVCLECGEFKVGAWTVCPKCGYCPDNDESCTKHLLVTDHYQTAEQLQAISDRVKEGQPVNFPPDLLQQYWVRKADIDTSNRRFTIGCLAVLAVLVIAAVAAFRIWH